MTPGSNHTTGDGEHPDHPDRLCEEILRAHCQYHPVDATFLGIHDFDHRLPDDSRQAIQKRLSELSSFQSRLESTELHETSLPQRVDHRILSGAVRIERWELEAGYRLQDPSYYLGEANFGIISLLLRPFAPWPSRALAVLARLREFPRFLSSAREHVRHLGSPWLERARREIAGGRNLLCGQVFQTRFQDIEGWQASLATALEALDAFEAWLETLPLSDCPVSGEQALELLIREAHCLRESPHEILHAAEVRFDEAKRALVDGAGAFGASDWWDALAGLAEVHPAPSNYLRRYSELWEASREFAQRERLVSWPDFPLRYVPTPDWAREAAPSLYFLPYRSPAPFDSQLEVESFVTPLDSSATEDEIQAFVRRFNDSVIKLNHVVHHGGLGHHVQNSFASRATSRMARIAATDCASRIVFLSGGTMAEGWACYATELMNEAGFLTPLESFSQHHAALRMASRTIVDVRLHCKEMSFEDACRFYVSETRMTPVAARGEATKNSEFPGAALMYLSGMTEIRSLRDQAKAQWKGDFSFRRFHDRLLSFGSLPVAMISDSFFGDQL